MTSPSWSSGGGGREVSAGVEMEGRGRHSGADQQKWMAAIDDFTFVKALGLGFLLSAVNPKNLIMAAGAGVIVGTAGLSLDPQRSYVGDLDFN
jgi:hypothetical protein